MASESNVSTSSTVPEFSLMTFNVWFDQHAQNERGQQLFQLIEEYEPTFLCFQEVTGYFVQLVQNNEYLMENYTFDEYAIRSYGVWAGYRKNSIISKVNFLEVPLQTRMDRTLKVISGEIDGQRVLVGTVHLESLNNHGTRVKQLQKATKTLNSAKNAILCGDFNFGATRNYDFNQKVHLKMAQPTDKYEGKLENDCLANVMPHYKDVWAQLRPDEAGFTFDSQRNPMVSRFEQMRYDRIMAKGPLFTPKRIEILGNDPSKFTIGRDQGIDEDSKIVPSDHFGLIAWF